MFDSTLGAAAAARARSQQAVRPTSANSPLQAEPLQESVPNVLQDLPARQPGDRLQRLGGAITELFMGRRPASATGAQGSNRIDPPPRPLQSLTFAELVRDIETDTARRSDIARELTRRLEGAGLQMPATRQGPDETMALLSGVDWLVLMSEGHVNISESLDAAAHATGLQQPGVDAQGAPEAPLSARAMQRVRSAVENNLRRLSRNHEGVRDLFAPPSPGAPPLTGSGSGRR